jgi:uncharacterized membrane protein
MDPEKAYLEAKQRFVQTAAWVSVLSFLLMAASQIPALAVTSPVAWLSGSFNIVMISLLGPTSIQVPTRIDHCCSDGVHVFGALLRPARAGRAAQDVLFQ